MKRTHKNIWSQILAKHNTQITGSAPKLTPAWQIYFRMRKDDINAVVARKFPDMSSRESFKERNNLAREWFTAALPPVQEECVKEAQRLHEEDMEAWELAQQHATPDAESQQA